MLSSIILITFLPNVFSISKLAMYYKGDGPPFKIDGDECPFGYVLNYTLPFTCVCITGLWAFYDNLCNGPSLILGATDEKCVYVNQMVAKVHLLSSPNNESMQTASIFTNDKKKLIGRMEFDKAQPIDIPTGKTDVLLSSGDKCLKKHDEFCFYNYDSKTEIKLSCQNNTGSEKCTPYITAHSPECLKILKKDVPVKVQKPKGRTFMRRKLDTTNSTAAAAAPSPAQTNATTNDSQLPEYHEDNNFTVSMGFPEMNAEIWNYMTSEAMEILNLSPPKIKHPPSPTFQFLEISKQILQKACPDHYVKDGHFDLALTTFMNLQKKHYDFNDAFSDYAAKERIEDSLYLCLEDISEYPFVDPLKRKPGAPCNETMPMGTFEKFGQEINLNVSWESSARAREPLIETVWKIFTHAHSACYKNFEQVGYNDHHRFTSAMMPVFTNDINDAWKSVTEVTHDTYADLLGDTVKLMDGVTYCAEFAKLDTEYPWELPRPEKELVGKHRRKRKSPTYKGETCLTATFANECANTKPVAAAKNVPKKEPETVTKMTTTELTTTKLTTLDYKPTTDATPPTIE